MSLLDKILGLFADRDVSRKGDRLLEKDLGGGFYYTYEECPNGFGGYHDVNICLRNRQRPEFVSRITGKDGRFIHFPGIVHGEWESGIDGVFRPETRYVSDIDSFENGRAEFSWMLQPDGRYFADEDGFGAEDCEEIWLYSYIDENGRFLEPFSCRGR